MNGFFGVAGALSMIVVLLGTGAGDSLFENVDERYDRLTGGDSSGGDATEFKAEERVVEGHTVYAVITREFVEEEDDETPPTEKELRCVESNPGDPQWPIFEECDARVGPIEGVGPVDEIEEIGVHADASTADEAPVVGDPDEDGGFWDSVFGFLPF